MSVRPLPKTPAQLGDVLRHYPGQWQTVGIREESWSKAKRVRHDSRRGRLRVPYGQPYTDSSGRLVGRVVELKRSD